MKSSEVTPTHTSATGARTNNAAASTQRTSILHHSPSLRTYTKPQPAAAQSTSCRCPPVCDGLQAASLHLSGRRCQQLAPCLQPLLPPGLCLCIHALLPASRGGHPWQRATLSDSGTSSSMIAFACQPRMGCDGWHGSQPHSRTWRAVAHLCGQTHLKPRSELTTELHIWASLLLAYGSGPMRRDTHAARCGSPWICC